MELRISHFNWRKMPILRLDKIIASTGQYSRSGASALINSGRAAVDSRRAVSGAQKHDPGAVVITIDGRILEYREYRYIMLNKPAGYVSSTNGKKDRTVMELLGPVYSKLGLFPAGRLDKDAEGLLLLTNDGQLAHRIISPSGKIRKLYFVEFDGDITEDDINGFAGGLKLNDGTQCLPAVLEKVPNGAHVTICEGKYHQVKRMMAAIGKHVTYLKRLSIGGLLLDAGLETGSYKELGDGVMAVFTGKRGV